MVNDLRIINGQLLVYSKLYYNAVQDKVDILSKLQEKIDLLLAEFNASVVKSIQESGTIKDLKTLEQKYDAFLISPCFKISPIPQENCSSDNVFSTERFI